MKIRKSLTTAGAFAAIALAAACAAPDTATTTSTAETSSAASTSAPATAESAPVATGNAGRRGSGNDVEVSSVSTETELVALVQAAYGDGSLDLHRGHQPVQDVLDEVLAISHDELHVRMEEQGQNLAAVAEDLDIDPQNLIDALVASRSEAVDAVLEAGEITDAQAEQYLAALEDAFTFRVTWDGEDAMPTFSGVSA